MTSDPLTVGPDDTLEVAATRMHHGDVSRLPVVRDGVLVGIVARTDIVRSIVAETSSAGPADDTSSTASSDATEIAAEVAAEGTE